MGIQSEVGSDEKLPPTTDQVSNRSDAWDTQLQCTAYRLGATLMPGGGTTIAV